MPGFKGLEEALKIIESNKNKMTVNTQDRKKVMEFILKRLGSDDSPKSYTVEELWILGKLADMVGCKINMDGTVEIYGPISI